MNIYVENVLQKFTLFTSNCLITYMTLLDSLIDISFQVFIVTGKYFIFYISLRITRWGVSKNIIFICCSRKADTSLFLCVCARGLHRSLYWPIFQERAGYGPRVRLGPVQTSTITFSKILFMKS